MIRPPEDSPVDYRHSIAADETPSHAVFQAVGAATDRDPIDLPALGRTIDTDSLDDLVAASPAPEDLTVRFDYAACTVTLTPSTVHVSVH
jgi:hypothetical protein